MPKVHNILFAQFVKTPDGKLECTPAFKAKYKLFVDSLEVGQTLESFFESNIDDGTHAQLAKVHACIRKLGSELGYTFLDMKKIIKKEAGFHIDMSTEDNYKSFADCSKVELAQVIETIVQTGDLVGINFR